jgi:glycosidase
VHKESPLYKQHPDWATALDLPGGKKNIRLWNEQRLTTWFDEFLPTLDLSKPEVYEMMSDSQVFWIREYGIDGFRHDAAKHVPEVYWRTLTKKINDQVVIPEKRSVYQIGESFGSRELIKSYISPGMMDAQFDFSVYFDATTAFGQDNTSLKDLNASLYESFFYFGNHHVMGNITGNQDLTRFITIASGALSPSEDATAAGWERAIEVRDTTGYRKLSMLMAFNMTVPGIPVIYYGDEFGMPGAGDPDNRRMMRFDSLNPFEVQTRAVTRQLVTLRKNSMPLLYGDFRTIEAGEKTWVYIRSYFDKAVIVILNKDRSERTVGFEIPARFADAQFIANFGHELKIEGGRATVTLQANSFEIISN